MSTALSKKRTFWPLIFVYFYRGIVNFERVAMQMMFDLFVSPIVKASSLV